MTIQKSDPAEHAVAAAAGVGGGLSGAKLPSSAASKPEYEPPKPQPTNTNTKHSLTSPIGSSWTPRIMQRNSIHQSSSEAFLGRQNALAVRDALTELAASGTFHEAKVGAGQNLRSDRAVRGDKIHWIQTPTESVSPVILHLRRQVETLVYGLKKVSPELDLRNVVSTQFAIFPGDGARFVKHVDTYSNAHSDERGGMSKDGLVRLVTCVYYLNDQWEPEHGTSQPCGTSIHFFSIPSYRDSECRHTVDNLLTQATFPGRVSIGICLQTDDDDDTVRTWRAIFYEQGSCTWVDFRKAAGRVWHVHKRRSCGRIDSHMRFRPGWDCFLINELEKCPSPKPILTTYPLGYTLPNEISSECRPTLYVPLLSTALECCAKPAKYSQKYRPSKPLPSLFWAAGFAVSSSKVIEEVPYDETLRFCSSERNPQWLLGCGRRAGISLLPRKLWFTTFGHEHIVLFSRSWKVMKPNDTAQRQLTTSSNCCKLTRLLYIKKYAYRGRDIEWSAEWGDLDPIQFDLKANAGKILTPAVILKLDELTRTVSICDAASANQVRLAVEVKVWDVRVEARNAVKCTGRSRCRASSPRDHPRFPATTNVHLSTSRQTLYYSANVYLNSLVDNVGHSHQTEHKHRRRLLCQSVGRLSTVEQTDVKVCVAVILGCWPALLLQVVEDVDHRVDCRIAQVRVSYHEHTAIRNSLLHLRHLERSRLTNNHVRWLHIELIGLLHAAMVGFFGHDKENLNVIAKAGLGKFLRCDHLAGNQALSITSTTAIEVVLSMRGGSRWNGVHVRVEQKTWSLAVAPCSIHVVSE
ncbi:Glycosyltransferase, GlcNAc [Phytophthora cactorum]|nr:Glycosyltransferase, GlcNAc [Phytophthora cactorum]